MLIVAVSVTGTLLTRHSSARVALPVPGTAPRILAFYLPTIIVQWSLVLYTCRIGRARNALPLLLGQRSRVRADLGLALVGWFLIEACEIVWAWAGAAHTSAVIDSILPRTWPERAVWGIVALSAGFGEEVVYRGYLQTQLGAFTRRASVGVALQAALFGVAHAEQGGAGVVRLAVYGLGLGALARWRRSLLPGIVCHAGVDLASGLLHR